jgi:hypothetical protein
LKNIGNRVMGLAGNGLEGELGEMVSQMSRNSPSANGEVFSFIRYIQTAKKM